MKERGGREREVDCSRDLGGNKGEGDFFEIGNNIPLKEDYYFSGMIN